MMRALLCFFIFAAAGGHAAEKILVDTLVLKPEAMAGLGAGVPEIKCLIMEESEQNVRVDLSALNGISNYRTYPKTAIQEVRRGSRHEMEWAQLSAALSESIKGGGVAPLSGKESELREFLAKHGDTPSAELARQWLARLAGARLLTEEGWINVDGIWVAPDLKEQASYAYKIKTLTRDLTLLVEKKPDPSGKMEALDAGFLTGLPGRIEEFRGESFYPQLLEGAAVALRHYYDQLPQRLIDLVRSNTFAMNEAATIFSQAEVAIAGMSKAQSRDFKMIFMPVSLLLKVQADWPELKPLQQSVQGPLYHLVLDSAWYELEDGAVEKSCDDTMHLYERLVKQSAVDATVKSTILAEIGGWQDMRTRITEAHRKKDLAVLSQLKAPEGARPAAVAVLTAMSTDADARKTEADKFFADGKAFLDQGDLVSAAVPMKKSQELWPQNPQMQSLRTQYIGQMDELLAKRKKKEMMAQADFLTAVWLYDADVKDVLERTAYYRSQTSYFDNMSWQMMAVIGGGGLIALFLVRAVAKMISNT